MNGRYILGDIFHLQIILIKNGHNDFKKMKIEYDV